MIAFYIFAALLFFGGIMFAIYTRQSIKYHKLMKLQPPPKLPPPDNAEEAKTEEDS